MEYKLSKPLKIDGWNSANDLPPLTRELYIVVQAPENAERVRSAAYWEQDANGQWVWNKSDISHWMKWPDMPLI
jgi:hypothetical protein